MSLAYPSTRREPVAETLHGRTIVDPYRWLEDGKCAEVLSWTEAQNALTDEIFAQVGTERFAGRLRELLSGETVSAPVTRGERLFFLRRSAGQNQPVLCLREPDGEERIVLDPNASNAKGTTALDWWFPSPDGRYVAYGYSHGGDEWSTLYIVDVQTGDHLGEEIPRTRYASVAWEPDNSGFYYTRYPQPGSVPAGEENYNRRLFYHQLGSRWEEDPLIFGEGRPEREMVEVKLQGNGRYLLVHASHGWAQNDLYLLDRQNPGAGFQTIADGLDGLFYGMMAGSTLYVMTNLNAPRFRLAAVDLQNPAPEHWREILPERPDFTLQNAELIGGRILTEGLKDVVSHLYSFDLDGCDEREVNLPPLGSVTALSGEQRGQYAYLTWESFAVPATIYRLNVTTGELSQVLRSRTPVNPEAITVRQVFYPSKDGTSIPMFILHRRDVVPNGELPTVLNGYGGFNLSRTPFYMPSVYPWLEQGGVYAIANLRGGGEYGEDWHRAGMLGSKQNVFDDFIAAGEYLVSAGYTRPERLGISGGSNGGLLVGAALTQRPDLFKAVVCGVPLLDMLRYHKFLIGALWVAEYGSADDPEQFEWLHAYSPYHQVQPGTAYPAIYFHAAASDSRVDPLHARKMAALVQETTGSENPVLLRIEFEAGHGAGKPVAKIVAAQAEVWSFFAWQLRL